MFRKWLAALILCVLTCINSAFAQSTSVGGALPFHLVAANSTNSTLVSPGNHTIYFVALGGIGSSPAYLKIYDKVTAPVCGTDTPIQTFMIPAASTAANGAGSNLPFPGGIQILNGLGICVTGGIADNDATVVGAASYVVNIVYK